MPGEEFPGPLVSSEQLTKPLTPSKCPGFDGAGGRTNDLTGFFVAESLDVAEDHGNPLIGRQPVERFLQQDRSFPPFHLHLGIYQIVGVGKVSVLLIVITRK